MRGLMRESIRLCPMQLACDGSPLARNRDVCRACERAARRRQRQRLAPLRGEKLPRTTRRSA